MNWYFFCTYILIPTTIIISLFSAKIVFPDIIQVSSISIIIMTILIFGLINKKSWSWKLLIILFIFHPINLFFIRKEWNAIFPIEQSVNENFFYSYIIWNLLVTLPNYIYYNKRKHLFVN